MKILDITSSVRGIWYQKNNPETVFMDHRCETVRKSLGRGNGYRICKIYPDIVAKWQYMPFKNNVFDMVVFDPPFIIRNENIKHGSITKTYGVLYRKSWREDIRLAFVEAFRVLKSEGFLILKWGETDISKEEILKLAGSHKPLFGTVSGNKHNTHWICFRGSKRLE